MENPKSVKQYQKDEAKYEQLTKKAYQEMVKSVLNDTIHDVYKEHPEFKKKDLLNKVATGATIVGTSAAIAAISAATGIIIPMAAVVPAMAGLGVRASFTEKKEEAILQAMENSKDEKVRALGVATRDYRDKVAYWAARGYTYNAPDPLGGVSLSNRKIKVAK